MRYLLSNDDGYQATGIKLLAEALEKSGEVTVVAPDRDRSGASNSLTLDAPIHMHTADNGFIYVNGTPTDCVHLAITGLLEEEPDMVLSGINAGANLGDDVLYSGTVAAAMEARFLGCPAIAISLASQAGVNEEAVHFDTAVRVVLELIESLPSLALESELLLNVNVPDMPYEEIGEFEVTRLGNRHKSEPAIKAEDPRGRPIFWVGPVGPEQDAGPGTDFYAINNNNVSITPMQVDLTKYSVIEYVTQWVGEKLNKKSGSVR
ncbi:MAG: 5'/3'-nucleotidase SurE [Gammaproteobacteria bacterium]|nr:MAG: 5'/3'-nucleotidase SurE [Gammaproteobacteria bacterium]